MDRRSHLEITVFDHAVTPIAGHALVGDMFTVNERRPGSQEGSWGFSVAVMTLARFYGRRT